MVVYKRDAHIPAPRTHPLDPGIPSAPQIRTPHTPPLPAVECAIVIQLRRHVRHQHSKTLSFLPDNVNPARHPPLPPPDPPKRANTDLLPSTTTFPCLSLLPRHSPATPSPYPQSPAAPIPCPHSLNRLDLILHGTPHASPPPTSSFPQHLPDPQGFKGSRQSGTRTQDQRIKSPLLYRLS